MSSEITYTSSNSATFDRRQDVDDGDDVFVRDEPQQLCLPQRPLGVCGMRKCVCDLFDRHVALRAAIGGGADCPSFHYIESLEMGTSENFCLFRRRPALWA
jgi:hypothetical protein